MGLGIICGSRAGFRPTISEVPELGIAETQIQAACKYPFSFNDHPNRPGLMNKSVLIKDISYLLSQRIVNIPGIVA